MSAAEVAAGRSSAERRYWRMVWGRFTRHRLAMIGGAAALALVLSALLAPYVAPYRFEQISLGGLFRPPSGAHFFGTDELGHDVFTRIIYAGRISLSVGIAAAAASSAIGTAVGLLAGFYGGLVGGGLMRITDMFISVPPIVVMFVLAKVLGPGLRSIVTVLCLLGWMGAARLVRADVLRALGQDYTEAARALGASGVRMMVRHVLPNSLTSVTVAATLFAGQAILAESTISYFGLGIQPPLPSWGNMLQNAQEYLWTTPWLAVYPGIFIFVTVLAFNFLGDGLRDALDPRLRL